MGRKAKDSTNLSFFPKTSSNRLANKRLYEKSPVAREWGFKRKFKEFRQNRLKTVIHQSRFCLRRRRNLPKTVFAVGENFITGSKEAKRFYETILPAQKTEENIVKNLPPPNITATTTHSNILK